MKSLLNLGILLIFLSTACFGQNDFRPGFIISNDHDTIQGYINLKSNITNCKSCEFRKDINGDTKQFLPDEIYGYRITDYKFYVSRQIEINDTKKDVFVEYLFMGRVDLFYYVDFDDDYYFISKDGVLYPLQNNKIQVTINNNVYEKRSNRYVGTLKMLFSDSPETLKEVDKVSFGYKPLINISKTYHNNVCKSQECSDFTKSTKIKIILEPFAGYYNSWNKDLQDVTLSSSGLYYGLNFRFLPFKVHSTWSFFAGLAYSSQSYHHEYPPTLLTNNAVTRYESKINLIQVPLGLQYTFPVKSLQPYVSLSYMSVFLPNSTISYENLISDVSQGVYTFKYRVYQSGLSLDLGLKYKLRKDNYLFIQNKIEYSHIRIFTDVLNFGAGFSIN
jgi:hypothetical protein